MSLPPSAIETNLRRAAGHRQRQLLLRHSATLGAAACLLFLLIGTSLLLGWITKPWLADALLAVAGAGALMAWVIMASAILSRILERQTLAATVERGQPRLLDRLNTLVFLEPHRRRPGVLGFYQRIAAQAHRILTDQPPALPAAPAGLRLRWLVFLALLGGTIWFFVHFAPYQRLLAARRAAAAAAAAPANQHSPELALPELALPTNNLAEKKEPWGEIRITEPGRDLRVTKVDVVPLHIEAAANVPLQKAGYTTTVNGGAEDLHPLPPPTEPSYAVYEPTLYLDELGLSDWDVLTYFAKAESGSNAFGSEVYFLEVRPFREDILKLPGGEDGLASRWLGELTALINRQQQVIRQTYQYSQKPADQRRPQDQEPDKLADAEADLSRTVRHLYAQMALEMENKPIGEVLTHLNGAEKWLQDASQACFNRAFVQAQGRERSALADLVATRKAFQKTVTDNPDDFRPPPEEPSPAADSFKQLKQIAEFRDEARVAQQFVRQTLDKERDIQERADRPIPSATPSLTTEQNKLRQSFDEFAGQHPQVFNKVNAQTTAAQHSLQQAAETMPKRNSAQTRKALQEAVENLEKLEQAMADHAAGRQLADAYKLKQMLDGQIKQMGQVEQQPEALSGQALQNTVREAKQTTQQLKQIADEPPTAGAFGPQLREALSAANKRDLDELLDAVPKAPGQNAMKHAAGWAKRGLEKVSQAFEQSQPEGLKTLAQANSLKPDPAEALERGLAQLDQLLKQMQSGRPMSREDQAKQGQEALYNVQSGLRDRSGDNSQAEQLLRSLERELKRPETPLDWEVLRRLFDQLQRAATETMEKAATNAPRPEMTNIDPTRLPPAYRERVQTYFRKLSEK